MTTTYRYSTPDRFKVYDKNESNNLAILHLNTQHQQNNIQSSSKYTIIEHPVNEYYIPKRKHSRNKSEKQNESYSPSHLLNSHKIQNSPTIKVNSIQYSPISQKMYENDSLIQEIGSRLKDNVDVINVVKQSRLERSKSRRKDQMWSQSRQKKSSTQKKKELIDKINMKLGSVEKIRKISEAEKSEENDQNTGQQIQEPEFYEVNKSLKRSLKPDFLETQIPTTQSILKVELSQCQNLLNSIKKKEQESCQILQRIREKKINEEKKNVRDVESFEIEGSLGGFNAKNRTLSTSLQCMKRHHSSKAMTYLQRQESPEVRTVTQVVYIHTEYEQYGNYIYPKYISLDRINPSIPQTITILNRNNNNSWIDLKNPPFSKTKILPQDRNKFKTNLSTHEIMNRSKPKMLYKDRMITKMSQNRYYRVGK